MKSTALKISEYLPEVFPQMLMKENFLHYLWQLQKFNRQNLLTTEGEQVSLLYQGEHNHHSGPDFHNARIQIGDTLWAGNVEIHVRSSEWMDHKHQFDKAYDNVILHVVFEENQIIYRSDGSRIPCLELKKRIPGGIAGSYMRLLNSRAWIPCQNLFGSISTIKRKLWLDRLLVERLERNTSYWSESLTRNNMDWEETFYQILARSFGLRINTDPFELMARSLPFSILKKHKNNLFQIEALLFGQAGMLETSFNEEYPNRLKEEYCFLRKKYKLTPIEGHSWKYGRLRPANFPTIRIAQFATLIYQTEYLFSKILAIESIKEVQNAFELKLSNYWLSHYRFDKESSKRKKRLGKTTIHLLIINTIAPFLFFYGKEKKENRFTDKALQLLEELNAESNHIIEGWKLLGMNPKSAYQTQALLQLKNEYCDKRKCLECAIGNAIINPKKKTPGFLSD